jgi:hypothetical protein
VNLRDLVLVLADSTGEYGYVYEIVYESARAESNSTADV